ncbi:hypothetical protein [Almyronema epifaneia]|uniref:Uncharacterized protein n=1 Tax=Almyronema epifaneia S1 TaxID=2991925 RepID=A0ABW6IJZ9_9CYAN
MQTDTEELKRIRRVERQVQALKVAIVFLLQLLKKMLEHWKPDSPSIPEIEKHLQALDYVRPRRD